MKVYRWDCPECDARFQSPEEAPVRASIDAHWYNGVCGQPPKAAPNSDVCICETSPFLCRVEHV